MTAKPVNQRVAELRARRVKLGLSRLELYVHPEDKERITAYAAKLQRRRIKEQSK